MKPLPLIDVALTGHVTTFILHDRQTRERVKRLGSFLLQAGVILPLQTSGQHLLSVSQSLQTLMGGDASSWTQAHTKEPS